jgi:RNA polymerase sigma factor (sigma-70 family)
MLGRGDGRPSRPEVERAALDLLQRHGSLLLATARRYAASPEDAEDAYQRGLEILLTKAPTTRPDELLPWLRTVIKHEAFALRRQRERSAPASADSEPPEPPAADGTAHERAERFERLRQGAEALQRLKPQEMRALLLRAEGYSYKEISRITGWTYTKVNRCLAEGRRAFLDRVAGIEAGSECERLAPQLSALADGEAGAADLAALRPHLRTCLTCRSRLREFRAAPARVAALLPPALAAGGDGGATRSLLESAVGTVQERAAAWGERAHSAAELVSGHKVAAVAASAAALAGGGATVDRVTDRPPAPPPPAQARAGGGLDLDLPAPAAVPAPAGAPKAPAANAKAAPTLSPIAPRPQPDPAAEFTPAAGPSAARSSGFEPSAAAPSASSGGEFGP